MLTLMIPCKHKMGETVDVRINSEPAKVTWADSDTLVINGTDRRRIFQRTQTTDGAGEPCWFLIASDAEADIASGEAPDDITVVRPVVDPDTDDVSVVKRTFRQR